MQYLVGIVIVAVFVAIWIAVDVLSRKRGLRSADGSRVTCTGCQCGGGDATCQIQPAKKDGDEKSKNPLRKNASGGPPGARF